VICLNQFHQFQCTLPPGFSQTTWKVPLSPNNAVRKVWPKHPIIYSESYDQWDSWEMCYV